MIAAVRQARDAAALVRRGAIAVVSVNETTSSMSHAIDAARARRPYTSPSVAALVVEELFSQVEEAAPLPPPATSLSTRERELLGLICAGKTDREAAAELGISVHTVRSHRQSMMKKLGVRGAAQLVRTAIERRLIDR
ncbi:MAG: response regulator transcription factor [Deltaproteobacteria bacterium]|nr:response regulator transcription factor [Deltaproteobacteria bacterium]